MTFRPPPDRDRWDRDPIYLRNRAFIRAQRLPCARCGEPIAYDAPYWLIANGRRIVNPQAFHCGHIRSRADGGTHDLANLQAEHAGCSIRSGAREARARDTIRDTDCPRPWTAERW